MSKNLIMDNLDQPEILEEIYRNSPDKFELLLQEAIERKSDSETLKVWRARLAYSLPKPTQRISILLLVILCLITGFFTKIPSFFPIDGEWYYPRFIPLIAVNAIACYFLITTVSSLKTKKMVLTGMAACILYVLILPNISDSASLTMALIHFPLLSLSLLAISFMSDRWNDIEARLNFIRYIGEMGIYSILILLGGMVLTGITLGLFSLIELRIEQWYMEYIVVLGLVSSPVVATYLFDSVQNRESKFAPILSNVFSPLFLITILAYLMATIYQGKNPFTDRDFLITFNGLLIVILALTIFSISGKKRTAGVEISDYINVSLVSATLIVNLVALSAILFRWSEYGTTVNRIVVTGANILIFVHLVLLLFRYIGHLRDGRGVSGLDSAVGKYLPIYTVWSFIVSVVLPLIFQFE